MTGTSKSRPNELLALPLYELGVENLKKTTEEKEQSKGIRESPPRTLVAVLFMNAHLGTKSQVITSLGWISGWFRFEFFEFT